VLSLGTVIAGAFPGAILAYLGADVVKVETLDGDAFRTDPQFLHYNRGVRSLGLDLKHPEGRAAFLDLVRQADVVVDNYRPGVRRRLGIDYPALKAVNPRIVTCSITAYGDEGARAGRAGFDPLLQAEAGMMAAQGGDDDPVFLTTAVDDVGAAGMVCVSVMAALNVRERTGEGQEIRTSLAAVSLLFQLGEMVSYAGRPANDKGGANCLGLRALHRYYACVDGWIGLACEDAAEAAALAQILGVQIGAPEAALVEPRDGPLAGRLEAAFAALARQPVLEALQRAGVPAGPAIDAAQLLTDEWLWRNGYLERWEHPVRGPVIGVRGFAEFLATPCAFRRPTPEAGEHSAEVLGEFGFAPERIARLARSGALAAGQGQRQAEIQ
jgi:crotonobetainyl-CoA:carnitine CoA-transferase CaiB-like acyl-CoA transferase